MTILTAATARRFAVASFLLFSACADIEGERDGRTEASSVPESSTAAESATKAEALRYGLGIDHWFIDQKTDPLDGRPIVQMLTFAEGHPGESQAPLLELLCQKGQLTIRVVFWRYLGAAEQPTVAIRVGKEPVRYQTWTASENRQAVYWPGDPHALLANLENADTLVVQVSPYRSPATEVFALRGLQYSTGRLYENCPDPVVVESTAAQERADVELTADKERAGKIRAFLLESKPYSWTPDMACTKTIPVGVQGDYYVYRVYENHAAAGCYGDSSHNALLDQFIIHRTTGEMYWTDEASDQPRPLTAFLAQRRK